jgi:rhamnogalacturonyl hydrolase YesR
MRLSLLLCAIASIALSATRLYPGLSTSGKRIEANLIEGATSAAPTVVFLGGMLGSDETSKFVTQEARAFEAQKPITRNFNLIAIPVANPDETVLHFPPTGVAYRENAESNALWRWIALQGADMVLIAGQDFGLANALSDNTVAGIGSIPARVVPLKPGILKTLPALNASVAHIEMYRRRNLSAKLAAEGLGRVYGHEFDQPIYIQGIALIGQLKLGNLAEVQKLAEPYANGTKNPLARPSALVMAGHLAFAELAERTKDDRYKKLVLDAANLGFNANGEMKESMPFHDDMSDSFFMTLPLLVKAGKLSGEKRYYEMLSRHFDIMTKLDLRADGLYRHSPLTDAAWSRGNAFPALGLALALGDLPKTDPAYDKILLAYRNLMSALARFQDEGGMWREVIDEPGSYAETSATAMIGYAMSRGVKNGWLDRAYQTRVDQAWKGVLSRIASDGAILDVCESTNKQKTLADYLHRAALFEKDPRGGAMTLLFATEMAGL